MSIIHQLTAIANYGATWILWLLLTLSVLSLGIIVERAVYLWSNRDDLRALDERLGQKLRAGDVQGAQRQLQESPSPEARIAQAALRARYASSAREQLAGASEAERFEMERRLAFLGTVGNNAPFVGLLGTVIGIVRAFRELDTSQGAVTAGLMSEVGEALAATAVGLLVALPAVAAFNLFQRLIATRLARGEALARGVIAYLEEQEHES